MPRRSRRGFGGLIFHVLNRGAKKARIFESSQDYAAFEDLLFSTQKKVQLPLLSYSVMPNHWHLVVWPHTDSDLSRFMKLLTGTHALRWNASRGVKGIGAVYQGRYKAVPVQHDTHLLRLLRYVERNPVRAGLVREATEWRWSSLWRRQHLIGLEMLSPWPIPVPDNWVESLRIESTEAENEIRVCTNGEFPLGDDTWRAETCKRLDVRVKPPRAGRLWTPRVENPPDPEVFSSKCR